MVKWQGGEWSYWSAGSHCSWILNQQALCENTISDGRASLYTWLGPIPQLACRVLVWIHHFIRHFADPSPVCIGYTLMIFGLHTPHSPNANTALWPLNQTEEYGILSSSSPQETVQTFNSWIWFKTAREERWRFQRRIHSSTGGQGQCLERKKLHLYTQPN